MVQPFNHGTSNNGCNVDPESIIKLVEELCGMLVQVVHRSSSDGAQMSASGAPYRGVLLSPLHCGLTSADTAPTTYHADLPHSLDPTAPRNCCDSRLCQYDHARSIGVHW